MNAISRMVWAKAAASYVTCFFFFQAEDGIRDRDVTGVQTCALPISRVILAGLPLCPCSPCAWRTPESAVKVEKKQRLLTFEDALAENVPRTAPVKGDYAEQAGETELLLMY